MIINGQNINIDDLVNEKYMHNNINNYVFLSEYQLEILSKYKINPFNFNNIHDLIYQIEEVLEEDYYEDLDNISREICEYNYYSNTDK